MDNVIRHLRRVAARSTLNAPTDSELLERFVVAHEEDAFAVLVRRHGPMVLGVCLRVLHHRQDAEDAFQATFLTLVRKGHGIRERGALASWLYRVAFRAALRLKNSGGRRGAEPLTEAAVVDDPGTGAAWRELRPVLDLEVQRLPAKYRAPMVLCYLEGKTYEEAANTLGCPKGTVAIRLLRGKVLLKNRLARRGLALSAGLVAAHAVLPHAEAAMPVTLLSTTLISSSALVSGVALSLVASASVAGLVREVARGFWIRRVPTVVATILGLTVAGVGQLALSEHADNQKFTPVATTAPVTTAPQLVARAPAAERPAQCISDVGKPRPVAAPTSVAAAPKPEFAPPHHVRVTMNFFVAEGNDCDDGTARHRARLIGQTETWVCVMPQASKCGRAGLACREQLPDDAATPVARPEPTAKPAPQLASTSKPGSMVFHIIFFTDCRRIIIFKAA
jgi:RNA polymerase sigma factor (sigma-70 family)